MNGLAYGCNWEEMEKKRKAKENKGQPAMPAKTTAADMVKQVRARLAEYDAATPRDQRRSMVTIVQDTDKGTVEVKTAPPRVVEEKKEEYTDREEYNHNKEIRQYWQDLLG